MCTSSDNHPHPSSSMRQLSSSSSSSSMISISISILFISILVDAETEAPGFNLLHLRGNIFWHQNLHDNADHHTGADDFHGVGDGNEMIGNQLLIADGEDVMKTKLSPQFPPSWFLIKSPLLSSLAHLRANINSTPREVCKIWVIWAFT